MDFVAAGPHGSNLRVSNMTVPSGAGWKPGDRDPSGCRAGWKCYLKDQIAVIGVNNVVVLLPC